MKNVQPWVSKQSCHIVFSDKATSNNMLALKHCNVVATIVASAQLSKVGLFICFYLQFASVSTFIYLNDTMIKSLHLYTVTATTHFFLQNHATITNYYGKSKKLKTFLFVKIRFGRNRLQLLTFLKKSPLTFQINQILLYTLYIYI